MADPGSVEYAEETHRMALENHRLALSLYDYIFPPWRWPKWRAVKRDVQAKQVEIRERIDLNRSAREARRG